MLREKGSGGPEAEEATVRRLDYQRLLRQSRAAFAHGDAREGLRPLESAAAFDRDGDRPDSDDTPHAA